MKPIFRWNGQPLGFVQNGFLYDTEGKYLGWVGTEGDVWAKDGHFVGEVVMGEYIMRNVLRKSPTPVIPRFPPLPVIAKLFAKPRAPQSPMTNWVDPFSR